MSEFNKIEAILRHIENVQRNCTLLGERLMEQGKFDLGRLLIAHGLIHDNSKLYGIEWEHMFPNNDDKAKLALAVYHHNHTNPHHPEYWGKIQNMPQVYIAEMICDWKTRSAEFGSSCLDWIDEQATQRFGFTKEEQIYQDIMYYLNLLCDKPFKSLNL